MPDRLRPAAVLGHASRTSAPRCKKPSPWAVNKPLDAHRRRSRRLSWIEEVIVSAALAGAAVGSCAGGLLSDRLGRRRALLAGDALFVAGAALMGLAPTAAVLIAGVCHTLAA